MADMSMRNFSMSYGELIGVCSGVYGFMTRDATEFLLYGITTVLADDFDDAIQAFIDMPQDQELEANEKNATYEKNELAKELRIVLRTYNTRAKLVFNENSGTYNLFYKKDLSKLNDRDLHMFAQLVKDSSEDHLTELATVGLTQPMIDDLQTLIDNFYDALFAQTQAVANRDDAANARVKAANSLYDLLTRYCEIGKTIWYEVNEAKYNDYIIYNNISPGSLTAPTNLSFYSPSLTFSWSDVDNASSYSFEISLNGVDFTEEYSGSEVECVYEPVQEGWMWFRVRARNSNGYGPYSTVLKSGYYPGTVLPAPQNLTLQLAAGSMNMLELNWDAVPAATSYSISRSITAVGAPAGPFNFVTNSHDTEYVETIIPGNRFYYRLTASNSSQWSGVSANVYIDVPE